MFSASASQGTSRSSERRRKPRLRADSIIYVQLGSENGGIVVNLGADGVAVQVAMELTAEKNTQFQLRIRGSGLNTEILGELVWLGATRKEVGISFQSPSAQVQQEIADWIERRSNASGIAVASPFPKFKPVSAVSAIAANEANIIASAPLPEAVAPAVVSAPVAAVNANVAPTAAASLATTTEETVVTAAPSAEAVAPAVVSAPVAAVNANAAPLAAVPLATTTEETVVTAAPSAEAVAPAVVSAPVAAVNANAAPMAAVPLATTEETAAATTPSAEAVAPAVVSAPVVAVDANVAPPAAITEETEETEVAAADLVETVASPIVSEPARNNEVARGVSSLPSPEVALQIVTPPPSDVPAPIQDTDAPSNAVEWGLVMGDEDSSPFPDSRQAENTFPSHRFFAPALLKSTQAPPKLNSSTGESESRPREDNFTDTDEMRSAFEDRFATALDNLLEFAGPQRWIPPVLLAAWVRGQRKQKLLLAGAAAACLMTFVLILVLAVGHLYTILAQSAPSASPQQQQTAELTAAPSPDVPTPQIDPSTAPSPTPVPTSTASPAPPEKHPAARPRPPQASTPSLAGFAARLLGYDSDSASRMKLTEDQVEVPVWTSKSSGYYYCADDPDYKSVKKPIQRTQLEALQSGYQPRFGQFCN